MGSKKGQITVFIIIGIIALVSVSTFLYMRSVKTEAPESYAPTIDQIPVEADPIRQFVTTCVRQVSEEGLQKVGTYGGYTSFENMRASLNPMMPTDSEVVQFSPKSDLRIPYWYHLTNRNSDLCEKSGTCKFASKRPPLYRAEGKDSIEVQLDEYVNENLKPCLRDFVDLQDFGFEISEAGDVDTKTVITQDTVAFHVNYPIVARKGGVTYPINEYFTDIKLNLREIYVLATDLTNVEVEFGFLEKYIINLISLYSRIDKDALPPSQATGLDTKGVIWQKSEVKNRLMELLTSYTGMLKVGGTANFRGLTFPHEDKHRAAIVTLYNNAMQIPFTDPHPNIEARFKYLPWWEPYFFLNCDGEMCGPQEASGAGTIAFFLQRYTFNYDVSLPVLVDLTNPSALRGQGFSFKFFLEANIRDNERLTAETKLLGPVLSSSGGETMLCDENKRNSENVTIEVVDNFYGKFVSEARVNFECGVESCFMGETNSDGKLVAPYPLCAGGMAMVSKTGYLNTVSYFSPNTRNPINIRVHIDPYITKDIEVRKYHVNKECLAVSGGTLKTICDWEFSPASKTTLSKHEIASVIMTRNGLLGQDPFVAVAEYVGDPNIQGESNDIKMLPGNYDILINLVSNQTVTVPAVEKCEGGFIGIGESCGTLDALEFGPDNPLMTGGAELKGVELYAGALDESDKIVLYVFVYNVGGAASLVHEDMDYSGNFPYLSDKYTNYVLPTYEKYEEEVGRQNRTVILNE